MNSCSANSITGEAVCVDNVTGVYILTSTTLTTTLTSGANGGSSFSGGECENCGVAVNAPTGTKGQAAIQMGQAGIPSGSAIQFLDLASNTFGTPIDTQVEVAEDILWDPFTGYVLTPNEGGVYDLLTITGTGLPCTSGGATVKEFENGIHDGEFDSAGEDCSTSIALGTIEFTSDLYIADLKQIKFTAGVPAGTWTAASQVQSFPEFGGLAAGTCALAVAPGSSHLGVVGGEFGGNLVGFIQLPSTSGSGTPSVVDYVVATMPNSPDGSSFENGYDPHTTTAYTSPNTGKAYAVLADWESGEPLWLAIVDIKGMLTAPRSGHTVTSIPLGWCATSRRSNR
ncbi:MAG: hypothetical protein WB992_17815 [Bryobacteraceae bacterium]